MVLAVKMIRLWGREFNLKSITVEPIMFLYMYMMFTHLLTFQALVYDKVCQELYNTTVCKNLENATFKVEEDVVQKHSSSWFLYINFGMGIPSFLTVLFFLGPWGDRVGRKVPVISPLIGALMSMVSFLINSIYMDLGVEYLLIGSILNGICGGYIAALMSMYSYVAVVSSPESRTVKIGILEAMIFLAATLGTGTSGLLLDRTGYVCVYSVLTGVVVVALVYAALWLDNIVPERDEDEDGSSGLCKSLVVDAVKEICVCVYQKRHHKHFFNLLLLMFMIFCAQLITVGENDIILLFTRASPFHWSQTTLGLYKGTETILRGVSVLTILPLFKWRLKTRDTTVIICGFVSKTAALLVLGIGTKTAVLFIGAISGLLQGFSSAGIRSMCSSMVDGNEQSKMFSLMGLFETFAQLAATSLFNTVYSATLNVYHGLCFLMAAGIIGSNIFIAVYLHFKLKREGHYATLEETEDCFEQGNILDNSGEIAEL